MTELAKSPRRGRNGAKYVDLTHWRKLFEDRRQWLVLARVELHEGETTHFSIAEDEILVDVVSIPGDVEMRCRLAAEGGIWRIPDVGTEVYVGIPDGIIDFVPAIVAIKGTPGNGLSATVNVLQVKSGTTLLIHDGTAADAKKLPTMEDFDNLTLFVKQQFDPAAGHKHVVSGAATTTMTTGAAPTPAPGTPNPVPDGTGTTVVKVK